MNKNTKSIILLCITVIFFALIMVISVDAGISLYELQNKEVSSKDDMINSSFTALLVCTGFILYGGVFAFLGIVCSLISNKIATNPIIKRITGCFLFIHSAVLLLVVELLFYLVVSAIL